MFGGEIYGAILAYLCTLLLYKNGQENHKVGEMAAFLFIMIENLTFMSVQNLKFMALVLLGQYILNGKSEYQKSS